MEVVNMKEKCPHYKEAEPYINEEINRGIDAGIYEIEESEYFVCGLLDSSFKERKSRVRCQGDENMCDNPNELAKYNATHN
jgi:hypothetical protein